MKLYDINVYISNARINVINMNGEEKSKVLPSKLFWHASDFHLTLRHFEHIKYATEGLKTLWRKFSGCAEARKRDDNQALVSLIKMPEFAICGA